MKLKFPISISFLLFFASLTFAQLSPRAENAHITAGRNFFQNREFSKAIDEYNIVLKQEPNNIEAIYMRGMAKMSLGDLTGSKPDFELALKLSPPNAPGIERVYSTLGNVYYFERDLKKARICLEKAIEINPSNLGSYSGLGNVLSDQGEFEKAIAAFDKALKAPKHPSQSYILIPAYVGRGYINMMQNKLELALVDFDNVIALDPNSASSTMDRGIVYGLLGRWALALTDIRNALDMAANSVNSSVAVFSNPNPFERLLPDLDKYISQNQANPKAWAVRGFIKLLSKDRSGAQIDFDKSFQLDSKLKTELEPDIKVIIDIQTKP